MTHGRALVLIVTGIAMMATAACSALKPVNTPFSVYNASLLNNDPEPAYPREPSYEPAQLIQTIEDDDTVVVEKEDPKRTKGELVDPKNAELVRPPKKDLKSPERQFIPDHAAAYVAAVYKANGIDVKMDGRDSIADLYETARKTGTVYHATRPAAGDLVFFHNTYDRNADKRNNDWYTHVGLVEYVEDDGTIHVLSYLDGKVSTFQLNLEHPKLDVDERTGKVWNTPLRPEKKGEAAFTQHLSGQLFAGFGNLLGDRTEFVVIDNWKPGMVVSSK